eukprot:Pgem_evm1s8004
MSLTREERRERANKLCTNCFVGDVKTLKCGNCATVQYCSKKCQRDDWRSHKAYCDVKHRTKFDIYKGKIRQTCQECNLDIMDELKIITDLIHKT